MEEYVLECSKHVKKRNLPKALKDAFYKYKIIIPEMIGYGVLQQCATCGQIAKNGMKYFHCPCYTVQYCGKEC